MGALFERLTVGGGAVRDGPRRYFLMRPDVLMGLFARLDADARRIALDALAASAEAHGGDSLRAYFDSSGRDVDALLAVTTEAAADLGWGRWRLARDGHGLELLVDDSPFAAVQDARLAGAGTPLCAPIRGLLGALASIVCGGDVVSRELACVACGEQRCRFVAVPADRAPSGSRY